MKPFRARIFAAAALLPALLFIAPAAAQAPAKGKPMELAEAAADAFFRTPYEPGWNKTVRPGALVLTSEDSQGGGVWFIDQDPNERCVFRVLQLGHRAGGTEFAWSQSVVIDARAVERTRLDVSATDVTLRVRKPRLICWRYSAAEPGKPVDASAIRDRCDNEHVAAVPIEHRTRFERAAGALREACGWR